MRFLHTMVRVKSLEESLHFYCNILGLKETRRYESEKGRFTLVFLSALEDYESAKERGAPLIELTYNWPDEKGNTEDYKGGRNFGHLAFQVDDIYKKCKEIQDSGVTICRPPRDGYMAFVQSPDGVSVELLQSGEKLAPMEPWLSMESVGTW